MQRLGSLFRLVVLTLVTGLALAGCQNEQKPDTAAYVGDVSITHADVENAVKAIEADVSALRQESLPKSIWGDLRQFVVQQTVFNELARRYAAEKGVVVPPADYQTVAQQTGLPADDPYVRLAADGEAYRSTLLQVVSPVTPQEADLRDAYQRFLATLGPEQQAPAYEEVKPQLEQLPDFRSGLGLRQELTAAAERYGTGVNPRYQPLEVPLTVVPNGQSQLVLVAMPIGEPSTDAVVNVPKSPRPSA